ncbi:MAG: DUF3604 domain-containing protein [Proteobacteria bacterium]|nr:DUF3604 domain-containing protein [Pseudomonadota bacterium]
MLTRILVLGAVLVTALLAVLLWVGGGGPGNDWRPDGALQRPLPEAAVDTRQQRVEAAAQEVGVARPKQILFGDLHVHTTFSPDAFMMALPLGGGDGARPVSDACDFARYCAELDFWSINDHALGLTPWKWEDTVASIRECNQIAGEGSDPDLVSFLGWEWTQMGSGPANHYGHKNVVIRGLADDEIPTRPIAARLPDELGASSDQMPSRLLMGLAGVIRPTQNTWDLIHFFRDLNDVPFCPDGVPVHDLPPDCREAVATPAELFAKLDDWGFDSTVIPHGTTWGFYTPLGSSWDKQLKGDMHDPERQTILEVYSGHGNSEEFRAWKETQFSSDGTPSCPEPTSDYLPSCWQAGEIIRSRCLDAGESPEECEARAADARQNYVEADQEGHLTVPGATADEWLDAGQCRDCFQPAFNYRPRSSAQYIMALRDFEDPENPRRFEFGFMAASDNHTARPGTGYKEYARTEMTEARLALAGARVLDFGRPKPAEAPEARSKAWTPDAFDGQFFELREAERSTSYFVTGGLMAVHAEGRDRDAIWHAMDRKEIYGTSGPRILLWFDLLNPPDPDGKALPMGGSTTLAEDPRFQVRAVGSFEQKPGCPADTLQALGPEEVHHLCRGECYHPGDLRRVITRIEVIRIRPQNAPGEPVEGLIEDPWRVLPCPGDPAGCSVTFTDADFVDSGRDALYYARAIEAPNLAVNADGLRCERDETGACVRTNACVEVPDSDDCLAETEQRAWSSPIFVGHGGGASG